MKKSIRMFAALFLITQSVQSQNMSNMHQVCTTVPTKAIHVSATGKIFYVTDGATDKRAVMYNPTANTFMTIDTGDVAYYSIEAANSNVYIGAHSNVFCVDDNGGFNYLQSAGFLTLPTNSGIRSIETNPFNGDMYFGGLGKVVRTNSAMTTVLTQIGCLSLSSGTTFATGMAWKQDTLFISLVKTAGTMSGYNSDVYTVLNNPSAANTIFGSNDQTSWDITTVPGGNLYMTTINTGQMYGRVSGWLGGIDFDGGVSHPYLTTDYCSGKLWVGTGDGKLFHVVQNSTWDFNGTSTMYNMNTAALNNVDSIFDVASDASGELWIATNKGVYTTATTVSTGINDHSSNLSVNFYPNPNNGTFFVNLDQSGIVKIYNVAGQLVKQENVYSGSNEVKFEGVAGCYFVCVETTNGISQMQKLFFQ